MKICMKVIECDTCNLILVAVSEIPGMKTVLRLSIGWTAIVQSQRHGDKKLEDTHYSIALL